MSTGIEKFADMHISSLMPPRHRVWDASAKKDTETHREAASRQAKLAAVQLFAPILPDKTIAMTIEGYRKNGVLGAMGHGAIGLVSDVVFDWTVGLLTGVPLAISNAVSAAYHATQGRRQD
ncbi:MAG: hypothetical protein AAFX94_16320 [Myxococcota bacterium]